MKKFFVIVVVALSLCAFVAAGSFAAEKKSKKTAGEIEFKEHCAACHPGGSNIVNPKKTLHKKDMQANGVKTSADIIKLMRNPGPGMTKFDKETVSDKDAKKIADYILKTYNK